MYTECVTHAELALHAGSGTCGQSVGLMWTSPGSSMQGQISLTPLLYIVESSKIHLRIKDTQKLAFPSQQAEGSIFFSYFMKI